MLICSNLGREVKAGDLTKEDSPWWGTFDYRQVPGGGDNWILSDYGHHLGLEAVIMRDCFQKMAGNVALRICGYFLCTLCKMAGEESLKWYLYLSSLFLFK